MDLDKDILYKGNKVYSPSTCIFVPHDINSLLIKCNSTRGKYPIGVTYVKRQNVFKAQCRKRNVNIFLGHFNNSTDAFECYKIFKENLIKEIADEYKPYIPRKLYDAMYKYEVEITD